MLMEYMNLIELCDNTFEIGTVVLPGIRQTTAVKKQDCDDMSKLERTLKAAGINVVYAVAGVVSLKRLLNQSNLKSWSSKMIKKSLEAYFFTLKNKIVFCKKQFQNMSVFCFVSTEIV